MEIILNHIYEHRGITYYSVVECDSKLLDLKSKLFTLEELQLELESIQDKRCDFTIENGILRCNAMLKTIPIDDDLFSHLKYTTAEAERPADGTVYALLLYGVEHDFVFLDGDNEEDWQRGVGVAAFRCVRFSHSTMSIYVPLLNTEGLHNKMIVLPGESNLQFVPFKFGVKTAETFIAGCRSLNKQVIVNNEEYWLWETDVLNIYDENAVFVAGLVNQCEADSVVFNSSLESINDYLNMLSKSSGSSPVQWAGSSNDYRTSYGVYFKSSCKKVSTSCREDIETAIYKDLTAGGSRETATKAACDMLKGRNALNRATLFTAQVFAQTAAYGKNLSEMFEAAYTMKRQLQMLIFWCCLYTYRIRTLAFLTKQNLNAGKGFLVGGNTVEYTVVNSFFEI